MCRAFSCLITKSKKVYWKAGVDSHSETQEMFVKKDRELKDDKLPPDNTFAKIEIAPANNNYLKPDKWVYQLDEDTAPKWYKERLYKPVCMKVFEKWEKEVYGKFNLKEAFALIHPFKIKPPKKIIARHLKILAQWDSVRASVRDSVRDFVGYSVGDSVSYSVRDFVGVSVGAKVGTSVWDSVWAYTGSLFILKQWKYIDKRKKPFNKIKGYPFQSAVKLWELGLVPSFDGETWRLHGGKKAKALWEGTREDLIKYQ